MKNYEQDWKGIKLYRFSYEKIINIMTCSEKGSFPEKSIIIIMSLTYQRKV